MRSLRAWLVRLINVFRQARGEREFSAELESHLALHIADNKRAGMTPDEARRRALLALGGAEQTKELHRDARGFPTIESLVQDVRFGVRMMLNNPGFTGMAVLTIAVGIAASNAAFTLTNMVLLRDLPFDRPERLLDVGTVDAENRGDDLSYLDFLDWQRSTRAFTGLAAYADATMNVGDEQWAPERYLGTYLSAGGFRLIGERPILGRDFITEDDRTGAPPVVIISHSIWRNRYRGDPAMLGRTIRINAQPATVIGVMREGLEFPLNSMVWQPLALMPGIGNQPRDARSLQVFGRLADGVAKEQGLADLSGIASQLAQQYPQTSAGIRPSVGEFRPGIGGPLYVIFGALMVAVSFVLLIGCVNVANLLLARSASRSREISIRVSLGATRWRIVRQLLIESVLLAICAGVLGLGLSALGVRWLFAQTSELGRSYWMNMTMDGRVFAFLATICLGTAVLFGLAPALHTSKATVTDALRDGGRSGSSGLRTRRWTSTLVIAEVVLTLVLLAGAAATLRSLYHLHLADRIVNTSNLLTMRVRLPDAKYSTPEQRAAFYQRLDDRLRRTGALQSATLTTALPFTEGGARGLSIGSTAREPRERQPVVGLVGIGPGYFETLGLQVMRGRAFVDLDGTTGREAAIVNQRVVERFFPQDDPIGKQITLMLDNRSAPYSVTVVGVSPTVRQSQMSEPGPVVYVPYKASPNAAMSLIVRTSLDAGVASSMLREEVRALDADLPVFEIRTMDQVISYMLWLSRVFGTMFAVFAGIALVLAAVGLYAVTAYSVTQRTKEIGIRTALGAQRAQVYWLILRRAAVHVTIGLILGLAGAYSVLGLLRGMLVGRYGQDLVTLAAIAGLLLFVCVVATLEPARRATRLNPVAALRYD